MRFQRKNKPKPNWQIKRRIEWLSKDTVRGKWGVSPLREAKTLLGVSKQQGLAGKGLIEAFGDGAENRLLRGPI